MTNRERILELIYQRPGLSDSELRRITGISPHQQVNQLCRHLARDGRIARRPRADGLIGNYLSGDPVATLELSVAPGLAKPSFHAQSLDRLPPLNLGGTLLVVPCSGSKSIKASATGGADVSVLDLLPASLADELVVARQRNSAAVSLDESRTGVAFQVYDGFLYQAGRRSLERLMDLGVKVVVISGGYGILNAADRIGIYDQQFKPAMWPGGLIGRCLVAVAQAADATAVIGVLARTSQYSQVFRSTRWPIAAWLVSPQSTTGAMVKAPRAQGEWLGVLADGLTDSDGWRSSDGLAMEVERIDRR